MRTGSLAAHQPAPGAAGQSAPVPGDGHAVHADDGPPAAPQAGAAGQSLPRAARAGGGGPRSRSRRRAGEGAEGERGGDRLGGDPPQRLRGRRHPRAVRAAGVHRAGHRRDHATSIDHLREQLQMLDADPAPAAAGRGVPRQHQRGGLPRRIAGGDPRLGEPAGGRARAGKAEAEEGEEDRRGRAGRDEAAPTADGRSRGRDGETPAAPVEDLPSPPYYTMAEIEEMLGIIQKLDPPGHRRARPARVPPAPASGGEGHRAR